MKSKLSFGIEFTADSSETVMTIGALEQKYPIPGSGMVDLTLLANPEFIIMDGCRHWSAIAVPNRLGLLFECLALDELHAVKQIRAWLDDHNLCTAGIAGVHVSSEHSIRGWLTAIAELPLCCETPGIAAKDDPKEAERIMLARKLLTPQIQPIPGL